MTGDRSPAVPWTPRAAGSWPGVLLLDLDGVVYTDDVALPGARETPAAARTAGAAVRFVTNNAYRTQRQVADRLRSLGVEASDGDVVTSSVVAAGLLRRRRDEGLLGAGPVAVVGGPGLLEPLAAAGFDPVPAAGATAGDVAALAQGFSPQTCWPDLAAASHLAAAGVWWVATNLDSTLPTDRGLAPGNGSLVRAVATAAGRDPDAVAGKPDPAMMGVALASAGSGGDAVVVGDRLDTDVRGAVVAGLLGMHVLTGVHGLPDLVAAPPADRPHLLGATVADVVAEHPGVTVDDRGVARCRGVTAAVSTGGQGASVQLGGPAWPDRDPERAATTTLDAARALCSAAWSTLDALPDLDAAAARDAILADPVVVALAERAARCGRPASGPVDVRFAR